jgi:hypothetical protein
MVSPSEYHVTMRYPIRLSVVLFSLVAPPLILVSRSTAQINGVPASVTSPGFGGRAINGTPPSVTSLGPNGFTPNFRGPFLGSFGRQHDGRRHHHHYVTYAPPVMYAFPLPYAVDIGDAEDDVEDSDANYQGGPTVFDRRGSGPRSYVPPVKDLPAPHSQQAADADPPAPEPPQDPTLLVFKNGGTLEVENYAIVGETLFDLTPGHRRRVALAELDLDATRQQNDARGVIFQLPLSQQAN